MSFRLVRNRFFSSCCKARRFPTSGNDDFYDLINIKCFSKRVKESKVMPGRNSSTTGYTRKGHMKNNFEYWVKNDAHRFLTVHWIQYAFFYLIALWLSLRLHNLLVFFVIGFLPYLVILIFRQSHNPSKWVEEGIKKYNAHLYERLSSRISENHKKQTQHKAPSMYGLLISEPESHLDPNVLAFKKNYRRINIHADTSLSIWFFTCVAIAIYLFSTRA